MALAKPQKLVPKNLQSENVMGFSDFFLLLFLS